VTGFADQQVRISSRVVAFPFFRSPGRLPICNPNSILFLMQYVQGMFLEKIGFSKKTYPTALLNNS
jgi:hypothetical protein